MAVVFVSHSTKDKTFALQVEEALKAAGHAVFVDTDHEDGIPPGTDWRDELFSAVTACNAVVFLNSQYSQASQWCHTELALAALHRKWIYSVNLTADVGPHPLLADKQGIRLETSLAGSLEWLGATLTKDFAGLNASSHWDRSRGPYPGLRSFEAADAGVFFGRDGAVGDVIKRLEDLEMTSHGNLLALIGPSGSGKSSLVKAGVLPRLADRGGVLIVGPFEPGNFPTDRLVAALTTAAPGVNASLDAAALQADGLSRVVGRMLDAAPECRRALVVIDQVEYLGTADVKERDAFLGVLDGAMTAGSKLTLLLIARQDRLEDVQRFAPLGRYITSPVAVLPIDVDGLRLAVEEPAAVARMVVDPDLTRNVIEDATDRGESDAGRALPLVAETLRAVYELATKNGRRQMTVEDYDAAGGVKGSIQRYAEQAEAQLAGDGAALDVLLPRFVTLEDDEHPAIGRPMVLSLLDDDERRLVGRLQDVRLLTTDGESVRIVHDRLIEAWPRLAKAVQGRRKDLLFRTQLERQATEWGKGDGTEFLLGSESTEQAEELLATDPNVATPAVTEYVAASRRQLTRRRRRRTAVISALAALALVASGLAVVALVASVRANDSRREAQRATQVAEARDLAARSSAADDPYDAALLAIEAESWTAEPLLDARSAWHGAETRLGRQAMLPSGGAIRAGDGSTVTVAWNPAGTIIATGNDDGTLLLFDETTHSPIGGAKIADGNSVWAVAWNPEGTVIAAGNDDATLRLLDASSRTEIGDAATTGNSYTLAVAWNPAGTIIATGNGDGTVRLFEAATLRPIGDAMIAGDTSTRTLAWNPAGTVIATGNDDGTVRFFDAVTQDPIGDPIVIGDASSNSIEAVAWNQAGTILATANDDGTLRLFDAATRSPNGDPIEVTSGSPVLAVAWNQAGTILATTGGVGDGRLRLFDVATRSQVGDPIVSGDGSTEAVAWSPGGTIVATGSSDGMLRLFDATTHAPTRNPVHAGSLAPTQTAWSPAGTTLAVGYFDGMLALFDSRTGGPIGSTPIDSFTPVIAWNPAGTIIGVGKSGTVQLLDATTLEPAGDALPTGEVSVQAMAWNPAGTVIAAGNSDGILRLFDASTSKAVGDPIVIGDEPIVAVAWNPASTIIAATDGQTLRMFDATSHSPIGDPITSDRGFTTLTSSETGSIIAVENGGGTLQLFDATNRIAIGAPVDTGGIGVLSAALNPAGTIIATGNDDGTLRLFDVTTGRPIGAPMIGGDSPTETVAWNPAGTIIASGNDDGTLRFFDSWSESEACAYLRTVMTAEKMDSLVGIDGAQSKCGHGAVQDLPRIPALDVPLP